MDACARLRHHVRMRTWDVTMRQRINLGAWFWLALVACMLASMPALAQRTEGERATASGPYAAEVPVRNQSDTSGFGRALAQVLAQVTGDTGVTNRPGVRDELGRARSLVSSFDFRQDQGTSAYGAPTFQTVMVARFKQKEVDELISLLGLSRWPQPRPKPVLWMAIDDGSGPRLVGLPQVNAARAVLDRAKTRGYALGLPAGNAAEQAAAAAIWRGDTAAIARLSSRYNPPMQLIGKVYRGGGGWLADWVFVDKGRVLSKWTTRHADARRAMAGGADGTADALFRRYAKAGSAGPAGRYMVRVTGIGDGNGYMRLMDYLDDVSVVKGVRLVRAQPGAVDLELNLSMGVAGFTRMVGRGNVLRAAAAPKRDDDAGDSEDAPAGSGTPVFRMN